MVDSSDVKPAGRTDRHVKSTRGVGWRKKLVSRVSGKTEGGWGMLTTHRVKSPPCQRTRVLANDNTDKRRGCCRFRPPFVMVRLSTYPHFRLHSMNLLSPQISIPQLFHLGNRFKKRGHGKINHAERDHERESHDKAEHLEDPPRRHHKLFLV